MTLPERSPKPVASLISGEPKMSFKPVTRRALFAMSLAGAAVLGALQVNAGEAKQNFTQAAFEKAQAEGKSILVEIAAPWCPACKAQKPIIQDLTSFEPLDKLMVFVVDFDTQKDALKHFRATQQSTLIAFKGKTETGRSVGDTKSESIAKLLQSAL
jgi:thiol-disulfide isomerase/thioredoxin